MRPAALLLALLLGLLVASAPAALARELTMESMHVELEVGTDGVVRVEERMRVRFQGSWNGILRNIPYADVRMGGIRRSVGLRVDAVEDGQGNELEHWRSRRRGRYELKIRVPNARDAVREIVVRYRAMNVILGYDAEDSDYGGHDELYWNVVGAEWEFPIEKVTCVVRLPKAVAALDPSFIQTRTFQGPFRSIEAGPPLVRAADQSGAYQLESTRTLLPGDALTIAIAFPPGHVEHPGFGLRAWWFLQVNWFLAIPLLALLLWILLWWLWGRDSIGSRVVIAEFEPPEGLGAAEAGALLDEKLDPHDVTAAIIDLAVRGVITIHTAGVGRRLELHRDRVATAELSAIDRALIDGLFGDSKDSRRLSSLKYQFVDELRRLQDRIEKRLVELKFWRTEPSVTKGKWGAITFAAAVPLGGLAFVFPKVYLLVLIPCLIGMFLIARQMPRRTPKGFDALARLLGMQEYMLTAERDRMAQLPMQTFERLMPYAVAFGLHERWMEAFADIYKQDPSWHATDGAFRTGGLVDTVNGLGKDVSKNLWSGPRPAQSSGSSSSGWGGGWSGGSGFSGGGSSGGGFGGGGGGGW